MKYNMNVLINLIVAFGAIQLVTCLPLAALPNVASHGCQTPADVVLVVDSSSSIHPRDFREHVKPFLKNLVEGFNIGPGQNDSRVGMMLFSSRNYLQFYLRSYKTDKGVQDAIQRARFRGGDTYTHKALAFAKRIMFAQRYGARPGVAKLAVVLTDGQSVNAKATLAEADRLRATGVDVFAVGVGEGVDAHELQAMASQPSENFVFQVKDFKALDSIKRRLSKASCEALKTTTPLATTEASTTTTTTTTTRRTTTFTTTTTTPTTTTTTPTTTTTTPTTTTTTPTTTTTTPTMTTTTPTTTTTTPTTTTTTTTRARNTTAEELPQGDQPSNMEECSGKPADIYFLLDASSSVYVLHFHEQVLGFVRALVSAFHISPRHTRVGIVTFSNEVNHEFGLAAHKDLESLRTAISPDTVEYLTGGTNTGAAIQFVRQRFQNAALARDGAKQMMVVVTDGLSQQPQLTARAAQAARDQGVLMFAVGVGPNVDQTELKDIASKPDTDFVLSVDDFQALEGVTALLTRKTCRALVQPQPANLADALECSAEPTNVIFSYESATADKTAIINDVIADFSYDVTQQREHDIRVGVFTQDCMAGSMSLQPADQLHRRMAAVRKPRVSYHQIIHQLRVEKFSKVPLEENRISVLFVDGNTGSIEKLQEEVQSLRFKSVKVVVIAVGDVDDDVLDSLVSTRTASNVIKVATYAALKSKKLPLLASICKNVAVAGNADQGLEGKDSSESDKKDDEDNVTDNFASLISSIVSAAKSGDRDQGSSEKLDSGKDKQDSINTGNGNDIIGSNDESNNLGGNVIQADQSPINSVGSGSKSHDSISGTGIETGNKGHPESADNRSGMSVRHGSISGTRNEKENKDHHESGDLQSGMAEGHTGGPRGGSRGSMSISSGRFGINSAGLEGSASGPNSLGGFDDDTEADVGHFDTNNENAASNIHGKKSHNSELSGSRGSFSIQSGGFDVNAAGINDNGTPKPKKMAASMRRRADVMPDEDLIDDADDFADWNTGAVPAATTRRMTATSARPSNAPTNPTKTTATPTRPRRRYVVPLPK